MIVAHEVETRGYVPVFINATGIEVDGQLFERAGKDWEGRARLLAARGVPRRAVGGGPAASRRRASDAELADAARLDRPDGARRGRRRGFARTTPTKRGKWVGSARRAAGTTRSA